MTVTTVADAVEEFYGLVNARAEAAILAGEPITGAHHRSLEAEIARHRADRDAAPAAAEGADTLAELIAKGEAMKEAFFTGDDNREAIACIEWDAAVEAARLAPAAAPRAGFESAWESVARELATLPSISLVMAEVAARAMWNAAAPRESGVVGAVLRELEWRHWSTRDGAGRMCLICERDEPEGHAAECRIAAAREAARGEGEVTP